MRASRAQRIVDGVQRLVGEQRGDLCTADVEVRLRLLYESYVQFPSPAVSRYSL